MNSISKNLKSYFNLEFVKKGKYLAIKKIDKSATWEKFTDDLFSLKETLPSGNAINIISEFKTFRDSQDIEFEELRNFSFYLIENKYSEDACKDVIHYISEIYPHKTELRITNWNIARELFINEEFINEFISYMNFRLDYSYKIVKAIEEIIENFNNNNKKKKKIEDKTVLIDVNPKQTEIIIALNELGILSFLREKHPHLTLSVNALANVLHLITGNPTSSIVSNINPLFSPKQKDSKNNPYSSERVVKKVKDRLKTQNVLP